MASMTFAPGRHHTTPHHTIALGPGLLAGLMASAAMPVAGNVDAAEGRVRLNRAAFAHNPEVAGSNPAPATRKYRSEA